MLIVEVSSISEPTVIAARCAPVAGRLLLPQQGQLLQDPGRPPEIDGDFWSITIE